MDKLMEICALIRCQTHDWPAQLAIIASLLLDMPQGTVTRRPAFLACM